MYVLINNEIAYATFVWEHTNTNSFAHVLSGADEKRAQQDIDIQHTHTHSVVRIWDLDSPRVS